MLALYIIAGILFLVLLLLCIPVRVLLNIDTDQTLFVKVRVHWLFGLIHVTVNKSDRDEFDQADDPRKRKEREIGESRANKQISFTDSIGLIRRLFKLVRDVSKMFRIGTLQGGFTVGFDDPADTGVFFAFAGPVNMLLNTLPKYDVSLTPHYGDEELIEGTLDGDVTVYPITVLIPMARFGTSRDFLRFAGKQVLKKWKR